MTTTGNAELIRVEETREKEGRDGRVRTRNMILWVVVRDGELLCERETRREAMAYLAGIR